MKSFLTLLNNYLVFGCLVCSSCTHYYYAPEEGNLLALNEKGDLRVSASLGVAPSDSRNTFIAFQAGYSPSKNIAFQFSYSRLNNFYNNEKIGKIYIASGAIGFYHFKEFERLNEETPDNFSKQGLLFDAYLGYGIGEVHNYYFGGGRSNFIFSKTYFQGGFHWQGKIIGIDIVGRIVRLDYNKGILSGNIDNSHWFAIDRLSENNPYFLFESSSRLHFGNKYVKFFFSQTMVFPQFYSSNIDYLVKSFHIGALVDIDSFFEKKSSSKKKPSSKK